MSAPLLLLIGASTTTTATIAPEKPAILAPEAHREPARALPPVRAIDPVRRIEQRRLAKEGETTIGGAGELYYSRRFPTGDDAHAIVDLSRLAIFLSHGFSEDFRFYGSVAIEHSFVAASSPGNIGVEQAYLDYRLLDDDLVLRAGLFLVPFGLINRWHEPPTYLSVTRPKTTTLIVPSTWSEAGFAATGELGAFRYEIALISGFNPLGFSVERGLAGGREHAALAITNGPSIAGRGEYEPIAGVSFVAGASAYVGFAGLNIETPIFVNTMRQDLTMPVIGLGADARLAHRGFEARAEVAWFSVGQTARLRNAADPSGVIVGPDLGSVLAGGYLELGYDVLSLLNPKGTAQLLVLGRFERYSTVADTASSSELPRDGRYTFIDSAVGIAWRPLPQIALKGDIVVHRPDSGTTNVLVQGGGGFAF